MTAYNDTGEKTQKVIVFVTKPIPPDPEKYIDDDMVPDNPKIGDEINLEYFTSYATGCILRM